VSALDRVDAARYPMDELSPDDLGAALRRRLPGARRHRVLALARPRTASERAWALICLGVALRHTRDYEGSLRALDAAVALRPERRAEQAAYLCAVAVHRERGDYEAARRTSRSMPE
jgi:tetratricopeptide (TPR) repeat protein